MDYSLSQEKLNILNDRVVEILFYHSIKHIINVSSYIVVSDIIETLCKSMLIPSMTISTILLASKDIRKPINRPRNKECIYVLDRLGYAPSVIADILGVTYVTVYRTIKDLEDKELIIKPMINDPTLRKALEGYLISVGRYYNMFRVGHYYTKKGGR